MTLNRYFLPLLLSGLIVIGWGTNAKAQTTHLTAQNTGLGGGGTAYIDGYHANFINPANLMLGEGIEPRRTVGFIGGLSTNVGGGLANVGVYNKYFTSGATISGSLADKALTDWFGSDPYEMKNFGMHTTVIPIGLSYREDNWGMSAALRSRLMINASANKGLAQLGILGFDSRIFSAGQPINFSGEAIGFHEASVGVSLKVLEIHSIFGIAENIKLYAGAAPKMILGANAYSIDFSSKLTLEGDGIHAVDAVRHEFAYEIETTGELTSQMDHYYRDRQRQSNAPDISDYINPSGEDVFGMASAGWGIDLGSTLQMNLHLPFIGAFFRGPERLRVGLSITDIGRYTLSNETGRFTAKDELVWRGFSLDQQRIDEEFNGDRGEYFQYVLQDSIANDLYGSFAPEAAGGFSRSLPAMVNIGGQLTMNRLSVVVDLMKGFQKEGLNTRRMALATGVEYDLLGFLPLRVGMRQGGSSSATYSAGTGLEFRHFEFSVGASTVTNSAKRGASIGAAWSGFVFHF